MASPQDRIGRHSSLIVSADRGSLSRMRAFWKQAGIPVFGSWYQGYYEGALRWGPKTYVLSADEKSRIHEFFVEQARSRLAPRGTGQTHSLGVRLQVAHFAFERNVRNTWPRLDIGSGRIFGRVDRSHGYRTPFRLWNRRLVDEAGSPVNRFGSNACSGSWTMGLAHHFVRPPQHESSLDFSLPEPDRQVHLPSPRIADLNGNRDLLARQIRLGKKGTSPRTTSHKEAKWQDRTSSPPSATVYNQTWSRPFNWRLHTQRPRRRVPFRANSRSPPNLIQT